MHLLALRACTCYELVILWIQNLEGEATNAFVCHSIPARPRKQEASRKQITGSLCLVFLGVKPQRFLVKPLRCHVHQFGCEPRQTSR